MSVVKTILVFLICCVFKPCCIADNYKSSVQLLHISTIGIKK